MMPSMQRQFGETTTALATAPDASGRVQNVRASGASGGGTVEYRGEYRFMGSAAAAVHNVVVTLQAPRGVVSGSHVDRLVSLGCVMPTHTRAVCSYRSRIAHRCRWVTALASRFGRLTAMFEYSGCNQGCYARPYLAAIGAIR